MELYLQSPTRLHTVSRINLVNSYNCIIHKPLQNTDHFFSHLISFTVPYHTFSFLRISLLDTTPQKSVVTSYTNSFSEDKGKFHPITGQEGPDRDQSCSSTLSLTSAKYWGWVVNATPRPLYPREREPLPIVQEAGLAPRPVWTGAENLVLTGIRSPDLPVRSKYLYGLSYPGLTSRFSIKMFYTLHHRVSFLKNFFNIPNKCTFVFFIHLLQFLVRYIRAPSSVRTSYYSYTFKKRLTF